MTSPGSVAVWFLDGALLVLALVVLTGVSVVLRRRLLARQGSTFELSVRVRHGRPGRGWVLGIGRYDGESLQCFRIFSLSPRPLRRWKRHALTIEGRRDPVGAESYTLFTGHVVVRCAERVGGERRELELAMSEPSLLGLQSWLESGPPRTAPRAG
ncbi:DUF2550 domain-containing protein [Nocardioidaceae bacterium]|nr:DUF2550 domain-containing protein [Nocardioidaceae bacterium]